MMARRMMRKYHVRCRAGEKMEITSKSYLSLSVLEIGSGKADNIYVAFPMDGKLHIGSGSVYSFYQFETPISDRLTDEEFRERLDGGHMDDNWNWVKSEPAPDRAKWTLSYRVD